ncbi:methyltransferase domain-containing protein [Campylobacter sp. VTCC 70190]|uniref:methyltransferase domain-containing protein n=1 Tax=Campylobacter sp. VTCC 70190 TaxID=3392118 RepID=UPI00398F564C
MNFLKAGSNYQKHSIIQAFMAHKLCLKLKNLRRKHFSRVFEFGCARGEFSISLQKIINYDEFICNDILPYKNDFKFEIFDMNDIALHPLSKQKFDLITSNATLQWLDLERILPILAKMLDEKGILLLSSFGGQNLKEIKTSTGFSLKYFDFLKLKQIFSSYFSNIDLEQEQITLQFDTALDVFKHLKSSGVNSLGYYPLSKQFLKKYEENFQNKLTYHPIFILCKNEV